MHVTPGTRGHTSTMRAKGKGVDKGPTKSDLSILRLLEPEPKTFGFVIRAYLRLILLLLSCSPFLNLRKKATVSAAWYRVHLN